MPSFNGNERETASVPPTAEPKDDTRLSAYPNYAVLSILRMEAAHYLIVDEGGSVGG